MSIKNIKNLLLLCCILATTLATAQTKIGQFAPCRNAQGVPIAGCKIISGVDGKYNTTTIINTCINGDLITEYINTKTGQPVHTETCTGVCDGASITIKVCTDFADAAALCAYIAANPNAPIASADCDNAGKDNQTECAEGTDPYDPSDDVAAPKTCADFANSAELCAYITANPTAPIATQDCDNGGVLNNEECDTNGNLYASDDDADCATLGTLSFFITPKDVSCSGGTDGRITFVVNGGTAPWTYLWSNGAVTQHLENVGAGNYTVEITDANGCQYNIDSPSSMTISEPVALAAACDMTTNESTIGAADGSTSVIASGGTAPYTYTWSNGATTASITGLSAGTYTVTVKDDNDCTTTQSCTISAGACGTINVSASVQTAINCNGASTGAVTASASGGAGTYNYTWSAGPTGLSAGTYSVIATDGNGCTGSATVTLTQPNALVLNMSCTNETSNNGNNGSATVTPTGGTASYSYAWQHNASLTTGTATGLAPGTYGVVVTDAKGCTATAACTVSEFGCNNPTVNLSATALSCFGANDGSITSTIAGGTAPYVYAWSNGSAATNIASLSAGNYTLNVSDANGCMGSATINVSSPAALMATCAATAESAPNADDGQLTANPSGGTAPYTYVWSNGGNIQTIANLPPGNYSATITDAKGCSTTINCSVTEAMCPNITTGITTVVNVNCKGNNTGSININAPTGGAAPYTFGWSNGGTTDPLTNLVAGSYTVTVTDKNGCTVTAGPYIVTEPATLLAAACSSTNTENGGSTGTATVNASGGTSGYSYKWSTGATSATITGLAAGSYGYTVTDANTCVATGNCTVAEDAVSCNLSATIVPAQNRLCDGLGDILVSGIITSGTAPFLYSWTGPSGFQQSSAVDDLQDVEAGTYNLTVTDGNGCTAAFETTLVSPVNNIVVQCDATNSAAGGSTGAITVSPSAGTAPYVYAWSNGGTGATITGLAAGTYSYTITDDINCEVTGICTVAEDVPNCPSLTAVTAATNSSSCESSGSILLSGFYTSTGCGPTTYDFAWAGPNGFTDNTQSPNEDQDRTLAPGNYTITITDCNGCTGIVSATVGMNPDNLSTSCESVDATTGNADGEATIVVTGGATPYSYLWSNGATTATITGVAAGVYSYTVTGADGCTDTGSCTVVEGTSQCTTLTAVAAATNSSSCESNGSILLSGFYNSAGCGATTYQFAWAGPNGFTDNTQSPAEDQDRTLAAGDYTITITDCNGCTGVVRTTVGSKEEPIAICTPAGDLLLGSATGGGTPYTYLWKGPNFFFTSNQNIGPNLADGTYELIVTDGDGCTANTFCDVSDLCGDFAAGCSVSYDDITSTITSAGTAPYTYEWSNGATTANITGLSIGTYTLTVTDANDCEAITSCQVTSTTCSASVAGTDDNFNIPGSCMQEGGTSITIDVKQNDSWTCDDVFFMGPALITGPINVVNNNDGTFTVTPNASGCGRGTFAYVVSCCNGDEQTEKINVQVCVDCNDSDDIFLTGCMPSKCAATGGNAKLVYNFPEGGVQGFLNPFTNETVFNLPPGYTGNDLVVPADVTIDFGDGSPNVVITDGVSDAGYTTQGITHTYPANSCYTMTYSFTSNSGLFYSYEYQRNTGSGGGDSGAAVIEWQNGTGCQMNITGFEINGAPDHRVVSVDINGTSYYNAPNPTSISPVGLDFTIDDSWPINTAISMVVCSEEVTGCSPAGIVCTTQEFMIVCE